VAPITLPPRSVAGTILSEPLKVPIAVRTGLQRTISCVLTGFSFQAVSSRRLNPKRGLARVRSIRSRTAPFGICGGLLSRVPLVAASSYTSIYSYIGACGLLSSEQEIGRSHSKRLCDALDRAQG